MNSYIYYILTADWQDSGNKNIIKIYGTGAYGYAEILIINKPLFFIERTADTDELTYIYKRKSVDLITFGGKPLDALYFNTQADLRKAAAYFEEKNIRVYESDIDPVRRFLMEKKIYGAVRVKGEPENKNKHLRFVNPYVEPAVYYPELKTASVDIETGLKNSALYSIGVHLTGKGKESSRVFILGNEENTGEFFFLPDELSLLTSFLQYIQTEDPDVITGWHVIGFDLLFLEKKCAQYNISLSLGRDNLQAFIRQGRGGFYFSKIPGRLVIDAPSALRAVFFSFDDFRLETVARQLLGEGKLISPGKNKIQEIENYFLNDKRKLAEYNIKDAVLVTRIIRKTGLLDLFIKRSMLSGLLSDQLGMMTAAFDHVYLPQLHKYGYAAPDVKDINSLAHAAGGYVMDPQPGIYDDVIVLDFKSLYPSIIRTFKIDPLSRLKSPVNTITTPVNINFSATEHILPGFIKDLMERREEAKQKKDKQLSIAIKLLMNSFYGVMGSSGCRFYHPDLPSAITGTGQWLLLGSKAFLEKKGYSVIYGDTDSLFIKLKKAEAENPESAGRELSDLLNIYWKEELKKSFNVESALEIEHEKYYRKFIITPARGTEAGAKKRYAGLLVLDKKEVLEFTGMESIRSDWTRMAKEFQAELYKKIFEGEEPDDWIRNFVLAVKNGDMDEKLIYRKRIRKEISEYKNLPPQIKAAKLSSGTGSSVSYVITARGPIPVELPHMDIDYQHYIDKQIKPIADSVLVLLGKSFDSIVKPVQLNFFG